ncbi:MAG: NADH-quinone oxidoreductase subunit N [Buchnera aphidicola (Chaetogeoica yunlongensis)]
MISFMQQLIVLYPLLVLILITILMILFISYNRNHFCVFLLTSVGLLVSFVFLCMINNIVPVSFTSLFYIDRYSLLYIGIVLICSFVTCFFLYCSLSKHLYDYEEFYLLLLFSTIGCISLIISNHFFSFFIGLELISLSSIGLISYAYWNKKALEAAFKYMLLSGVISACLLFGMSLIYSVTGSFELSSIIYELVMMVKKYNFNIILFFGFSLFIISVASKLSIFPFHIWTPDVYEGTSSKTLIFFSTATKIAIFSFLYKIFIILASCHIGVFSDLLNMMSCISIIIGNLMAIRQTSFSRLIGYASISQFGYLFITLFASNYNIQLSLEVVGIYLIGYAIANIGIFGLISVLSSIYRKCNLDLINSYTSFFWYNPILSTIMIIMIMSLSGIPITLGFIGKFYLMSLVVKEKMWFFGFLILVSTAIGLYAYLKIISKLFIVPDNKNFMNRIEIFSQKSGIIFLILFLILISILALILGIFPYIIINLVYFFQF